MDELMLTIHFGKKEQLMSTRSVRAHGVEKQGILYLPLPTFRFDMNSDKEMQMQQELAQGNQLPSFKVLLKHH